MSGARPLRSFVAGRSGQAAIEIVAGIPVLFLAAGVALQLLLAGYSQSLADGAAEAGALALAAGGRARPSARNALPRWASERAVVSVDGGAVEIHLRAPSVLPGSGELLTLRSRAWASRGPGPRR